ncbi:MAG: chorismate synthase [Candidatus Kariarchaeaceae archaeon]|jgi:chorismate synthase
MNSFGERYRITLIGSSHGNLVGVTIDGVPPGFHIDLDKISSELERRRPGQSKVTTDRKEGDELIIEAGILNGTTTGEPIVAFVRNKDIDSSYYDEIKDTPRPGHADYPAFVKYKGANDYRGGGRFSGRMTVGLVIAGSIARQIMSLQGIDVIAYTKEINGISGNPSNYKLNEDFIYSDENIVRAADEGIIQDIIARITELKEHGNSCGGIVECQVLGLPVGVGEPWFDSIESKIAHMGFSIPAVKGIEFGSGFTAAKMTGQEHNDPYETDEEGNIVTRTNNAGGILGGLSNGMPVVYRIAFKPTSSVLNQQDTIDTTTGEATTLKVRGRHDPCIVPRAVPVVANATAVVIFDLILTGGLLQGGV